MMYETDTPVTSATSDDIFLDSKDINDLDLLQKKSRRGPDDPEEYKIRLLQRPGLVCLEMQQEMLPELTFRRAQYAFQAVPRNNGWKQFS